MVRIGTFVRKRNETTNTRLLISEPAFLLAPPVYMRSARVLVTSRRFIFAIFNPSVKSENVSPRGVSPTLSLTFLLAQSSAMVNFLNVFLFWRSSKKKHAPVRWSTKLNWMIVLPPKETSFLHSSRLFVRGSGSLDLFILKFLPKVVPAPFCVCFKYHTDYAPYPWCSVPLVTQEAQLCHLFFPSSN